MKIEIPDNILSQTNLSKEALLIEIATTLYKNTELSWAAAAQLADISRDEFMQELAKRKIPIKYSIQDLENDLGNFNSFVNDSGK